jgi:hypothetical protein
MKNAFRAFISNFPFLNADEAEIIVENTILREFNKGYIYCLKKVESQKNVMP